MAPDELESLPQDDNGEVKLPDDLPDDISMKVKDGGKIRRIVVNREKCIGAESCVLAAPGVFQLDEKNLAYVNDPNSEDDDAIKMAAQSCPVLAIHLYNKDGTKIFPSEDPST